MSAVRTPRCLLSECVLLSAFENMSQGLFIGQIWLNAEQLPGSDDTNINFIDRASQ